MDKDRKLERIEKAIQDLSPLERNCRLCPRACRVDRTKGEKGLCRAGLFASVSHALLHFGEEPILSGVEDCRTIRRTDPGQRAGSGTIFFSGCNLKCLFCQNYQLSWLDEGHEVTDTELAAMMLDLQNKGALNINLVTPTHVVLPLLRALRIACQEGLTLPLVYNSNGYENVTIVQVLDDIIDVYLPDMKYHSHELSERYSGAPDYFARAAEAVREMSLQRPVLKLDGRDYAREGLIIRHLVLPGAVEDSLVLLRWMKENLAVGHGLSLMSQYHPCYRAPEEIHRTLKAEEYAQVVGEALRLGFHPLFTQPEPFQSEEHLVPDFRRKEPFRWK